MKHFTFTKPVVAHLERSAAFFTQAEHLGDDLRMHTGSQGQRRRRVPSRGTAGGGVRRAEDA